MKYVLECRIQLYATLSKPSSLFTVTIFSRNPTPFNKMTSESTPLPLYEALIVMFFFSMVYLSEEKVRAKVSRHSSHPSMPCRRLLCCCTAVAAAPFLCLVITLYVLYYLYYTR